jgi:nucleoside phosphorylase
VRVIIIDDDDSKRNEIISALCISGVIIKSDFIECKSIMSAKEALQKEKFDVMLLDLNLPLRDNDSEIKSKEGLKFLKEFKYHRKYHQPREIIGITSYEEELKEVKEDFENNLIHIIHYHTVKEDWKEKLIERFQYLESSIKEKYEYNYDLAIICALEDPELLAIRKLSTSWTRIYLENTSIPYYETYFEFEKKKLKVIIVSINKMGMVPTAVLSTQTIQFFRPKYLAMTGIAAGIESSGVKLGDILVVNPSWDSGAGKIKKDMNDEPLFEIDPRQETIDSDINYNILELSNDNVFLNTLRENWITKIPTVLNVHIGPVASGAAVIADGDISKKIQKQCRKLIGIEMEAYGLIYAAKYATNPKPEPIVIKSICDFADEHKNNDYQSYAAYTSAGFLYEFAKRYINPLSNL